MNSIPLLRRKQIWWPTLAGWLLLCVALLASGYVFWRHIYGFLAPTEPAPGARLLVVEGWMPRAELDQAIAIFRAGHYERVVTTGGPIDEWWASAPQNSSFADMAARYLRTHGLADVDVQAAPAPPSAQDRTFLNAVKLREWIDRQHLDVKALDVVSAGPHARRSRMMYRMALGPKVDVGIIAAHSSEFNEGNWWKSSAGAKAVLGETISIIWVTCFFHPPAPGSWEEAWGPRPPQAKPLRSPGS